ncbi:MAG: RNA polymerase sigma factor [Acidimicrobiia bacterium]
MTEVHVVRTATQWAPAGFAAILQGVRRREPAACQRLWTALSPAVAGYVRMQGAHEPDELTSEVFLGVFSGIERFEGDEAAFRSWLFTIAHRRLVDERRSVARRPRTVPLDRAYDSAGGDAEGEAWARLETDRVRGLLGQLSPAQRDVLLLRFVGGLTVEETAEVVERTVPAVKALSRRGLGSLRTILAEVVSE